jgi:hypothetical protein
VSFERSESIALQATSPEDSSEAVGPSISTSEARIRATRAKRGDSRGRRRTAESQCFAPQATSPEDSSRSRRMAAERLVLFSFAEAAAMRPSISPSVVSPRAQRESMHTRAKREDSPGRRRTTESQYERSEIQCLAPQATNL